MISSLVGLLLILVGLAFAAASYGGHPFIESEGLKSSGAYVGGALIAAGFVIGKFWSLKVKTKYTYPPAEFAQAAAQPERLQTATKADAPERTASAEGTDAA
jgi:hypothetical protein